MQKSVVFSVFILITFGSKMHSQVTMLSSNPMKKKQFIAYTSFKYYKTQNKYNWTDNKYYQIPDVDKVGNASMLAMMGYGVTNKLAMYIQYPIFGQLNNNEHSFYDGEILLMSRYAIIPSSSEKTGLTLIGALRFPTTTDDNHPFADNTVDFIFGEIFSTAWYHNWRTHIKSEFYINTKNSKNENPGEEFRVCLKQDLKLGKIKFYLANMYSYKFNNRNEKNEIIVNTQKQRLLHLLGAEYVIKNSFRIKPKFQIFSIGKGGTIFRKKLILELFYYF